MAEAVHPSSEQASNAMQPAVDSYMPLDGPFYEDPYRYFHQLRAEAPVHWSEPIES